MVSLKAQNILERYPEVFEIKKSIDNNESLQPVILENDDFTDDSLDGGGEVIGFYNNTTQEIKKISITLFLSYGIQRYSFYLKNEKLVLVMDKFKQFDYDKELNKFDDQNFDGGFIGTYIFNDNCLIDHISFGHNRFEDHSIDIEETFLKELDFYSKKISEALND